METARIVQRLARKVKRPPQPSQALKAQLPSLKGEPSGFVHGAGNKDVRSVIHCKRGAAFTRSLGNRGLLAAGGPHSLERCIMPRAPVRNQQMGDLHSVGSPAITGCYTSDGRLREMFERSVEKTRLRYALFVTGYVVMPEHVYLLVSEPNVGHPRECLQALKLSVAVQRREDSRRRRTLASEPQILGGRGVDPHLKSEMRRTKSGSA